MHLFSSFTELVVIMRLHLSVVSRGSRAPHTACEEAKQPPYPCHIPLPMPNHFLWWQGHAPTA